MSFILMLAGLYLLLVCFCIRPPTGEETKRINDLNKNK